MTVDYKFILLIHESKKKNTLCRSVLTYIEYTYRERHAKKQIYSDVWYEEERKKKSFLQYLVSDVIQYAYRKWEASRHSRRRARVISKYPDSDLRCQNLSLARFVRLSSRRINTG